MTNQIEHNFFQSLLIKIGSSAPGAWLLARSGHRLDKFVLRHTNGRMTAVNFFSGVPVVTITTIGAKSGLPRTQPLIAIRDPDAPQIIALIASNWGQKTNPAWYYNLKANPEVIVTENESSQTFIAHQASDAEYDRFWKIGVQIYPGYSKYQDRNKQRRIPIMILIPKEEMAADPANH